MTMMTGGKTDWVDNRVHDYCRNNMSAYWFGYFLPSERCRIWMLFCYCFRAFDAFTDVLAPRRARREMNKFYRIYVSVMSGERIPFGSDLERYVYALLNASMHDKKIISYLLKGYSAQKDDVTRGKFVDAKKLERIRRGKATEIMKLWIYLADPTLPGKAIEKIGRTLGLCGQYLDDLQDLEEDFRMKKSTITEEQVRKYGIRTVDDVYESGLATDLFKNAKKLHEEARNEIKKVENPLTRLFLLTFALRFDPRDIKFDDRLRAKGATNVLKKILNSLKGVYPRSHTLGHALAYVICLPILLMVLVSKGYAKYLLA